MNQALAILNTSILTTDGAYVLTSLSLDEAQALALSEKNILSAVGHDATAAILTELLGVPIAVNRINFEQQVGQTALVFKLHGRAPEGVILDRAAIEAIGYGFKRLVRFSTEPKAQRYARAIADSPQA